MLCPICILCEYHVGNKAMGESCLDGRESAQCILPCAVIVDCIARSDEWPVHKRRHPVSVVTVWRCPRNVWMPFILLEC